MGGGPDHWAVEAHLRAGLKVYATPDAARTFDDDLDRVAAMGIRIVDSPDAMNGARRLELRDFYLAELLEALRAFGVSTVFDALAVAVFDHGAAPPGVSDRRFRFDYLREQVERGIGLEQRVLDHDGVVERIDPRLPIPGRLGVGRVRDERLDVR